MTDPISLVPRPAKLQQGVIGILEEALAQAKTGLVTDVAIAMVCSDGYGRSLANATDNRLKLIGATSLLLRDLHEGSD